MAELVTIKEYAALVGVHANTVARWLNEGAELPEPAVGLWVTPRGRRFIRVDKRQIKDGRAAEVGR